MAAMLLLRLLGAGIAVESISLGVIATAALIGLVPKQLAYAERAEETLREMEKGFRRAFDDAPLGMALVSVEPGSRGRLIQVNQTFAQITGYSEQKLLSSDLLDLTHPEDLQAEVPLMNQLVAGRIPSYKLEERYLRADGHPVWVSLNASTVRDHDGRLLYGLAQVQDMTDHKQNEQRLARAAAELQSRASELERSNADLQEFAYAASHDLSEPLRMVKSYLQLLAKRYQGQLDSNADEFIAFAVDGANRMQALIDGMLLYSKAGTYAYTRVPVDCSKVVGDVLATMEGRVRETGATVTVDPLPTIYGDEVELGRLFQNLLSNALKFVSDRPPRVRVSAERAGSGWRFSVQDNGIEIDPRHAERIFKVFQRLHSRDAYPGSGIGLATCKRIVERHGGRIWVDPVAAGGTAFRFTIPGRETRRDSREDD